jgi:hypothetical protein
MQKASIGELLSASGHATFTPELVQRAMFALYGNIGANLDERNWSAILQSDNPLEAAEADLLAMYQDSGYLLRNVLHLVQSVYVAAQAEITYRQLADRLGFICQSDWSAGTSYANLGQLSLDQLQALVPTTITSVAITSASGVVGGTLNAGDVLSVTATMSEATTVTGTPQLALNIGGTTVQASYASGSGSTALVFSYTILAAQTDGDGISMDANSLTLDGGRLADAAGNAATMTHTSVSHNASYLVDTTAPTLAITTPISGGYINDAEDESALSISGTSTGAQGQSVSVSVGGTIKIATIANGGAWTVSLSAAEVKALSEGTVNLTADVFYVAGNPAVQATASYVYDTTAPTANATTSTIANTANATGQSTEIGTAYLVDSTIAVTSLSDITGAADNRWNSVAISTANSDTSLSATGLAGGTYKAYTTDAAGNLSLPSTDSVTVTSVDTSIVVFNMVAGVSSSHSSREFRPDIEYTIFIRVDSQSADLVTIPSNPNGQATWGVWGLGGAIGADDRIMLVG